MSEDSREENVYMAKLAEQAERYAEMVEVMKSVARMDVELTIEERNLLSVAYKNVIGSRCSSWRIISCIEQKEENTGNKQHLSKIKEYRSKVEAELASICSDILTILDDHLIPSATTCESKVFYYRMKGNNWRHLADFTTGAAREEGVQHYLVAYESAHDTAVADLSPTHPTRLGLVLSLSTFYYEVLNSPDRACHLAKQTLDDATAGLDALDEESCKESTLMMNILRGNLNVWSSGMQGEVGDKNSNDSGTKAWDADADV